jgi:hypothetical protein
VLSTSTPLLSARVTLERREIPDRPQGFVPEVQQACADSLATPGRRLLDPYRPRVPITSDSPRRRSCLPSVARRPVLGLALVLWTGWAPPPVAAAERWLRPVPGEASRAFSLGANQFARGPAPWGGPDRSRRRSCSVGVRRCRGLRRRGSAGAPRRDGPLRRWRVTYLPLEAVSVRAVSRWRRAAASAASAQDTAAFTSACVAKAAVRLRGPAPAIAGRSAASRPGPPSGSRSHAHFGRRRPPLAGPARCPLRRNLPRARRRASPCPAWLGLALLLTGATGGQTVALRRRRRRTALNAREVVASRLTATTAERTRSGR